MNREVLDRWCERGIIGLVLAILVIGPLAAGAVRTLEFLVIQGLTMVVMALWGLRFWLNPRPQLLWPPICWAVIAFAVYAVIRYLTADIEYVARQELIRVLIYTFLFFAILNNLHRQESTQVISLTLIFLAMAISLYAIYQFLTGSSKVPSLGAIIESLIFPHKNWFFNSPYPHRGAGTYINPNHLGGFLELLAPLGLAYTLTSRLKPVAKVFLGYAALAILAGIEPPCHAEAGSRSCWPCCFFSGRCCFIGPTDCLPWCCWSRSSGQVASLCPRPILFKRAFASSFRRAKSMTTCGSSFGSLPFDYGRIIPGGAPGPGISIIGSAPIGQPKCNCSPIARTMIF